MSTGLTGLASYWQTTPQLTDFERARIISVRAVMLSDGKAPLHAGSRAYVEDVADAEMRHNFLRGLRPCRAVTKNDPAKVQPLQSVQSSRSTPVQSSRSTKPP